RVLADQATVIEDARHRGYRHARIARHVLDGRHDRMILWFSASRREREGPREGASHGRSRLAMKTITSAPMPCQGGASLSGPPRPSNRSPHGADSVGRGFLT